MKKHRYTAAAVMLSLSMLTGAAAADYSDLKPHWAEQAMEFAVQSNLMDGISEYTFAADAPATRACLVQRCTAWSTRLHLTQCLPFRISRRMRPS